MARVLQMICCPTSASRAVVDSTPSGSAPATTQETTAAQESEVRESTENAGDADGKAVASDGVTDTVQGVLTAALTGLLVVAASAVWGVIV